MKDNPEVTMQQFMDQFGPLDEHKLLVLRIIFEELYGKNLSVSNEKRQEQNQSSEDTEWPEVQPEKS